LGSHLCELVAVAAGLHGPKAAKSPFAVLDCALGGAQEFGDAGVGVAIRFVTEYGSGALAVCRPDL